MWGYHAVFTRRPAREETNRVHNTRTLLRRSPIASLSLEFLLVFWPGKVLEFRRQEAGILALTTSSETSVLQVAGLPERGTCLLGRIERSMNGVQALFIALFWPDPGPQL
jgi:hypothetical protein